MLIKKDDFEISLGKGVGHVLEDIILGAEKRLWVTSPWVSPKYAEVLVKKAKDGVDVKLLTSNDLKNVAHRKSMKQMVSFKRKVERVPAYLSFVLTALFIALSSLSLPWLALTIFPIYIFYKYGLVFIAKPELDLVVFNKRKKFTHSKIYISDDISVTGSANLTESGLWNNIETVVVIRDKEITEEISKVFLNMEQNPLMKRVTLESMRKELK
jgi:phosphatidylserine/phosphatidylglycerophosphate/cardiolipin synthase-like enzyme